MLAPIKTKKDKIDSCLSLSQSLLGMPTYTIASNLNDKCFLKNPWLINI